MDTESPKTEFIAQAMPSPVLSPTTSLGSDSRMGYANNSATRDQGDLTTMTRGVNIPSFTWSSIPMRGLPMPEFTESAVGTFSPQETTHGDPSGVIAAFDGISPYGYPSGVGCFGCVLRMAIGLSIILAMTSLLILCCLSRRGQYIWINTVNIVSTQNPIAQQERIHGRHCNSPYHVGSGDVAEERFSSEPDVDRSRAAPEDRSGVDPRPGIEGASRSGTSSRQNVRSLDRLVIPGHGTEGVGVSSRPAPSQLGFFQWFGFNPSQAGILKGPGFLQRWFGWKREKHVNFNDAPLRDPRNGRKISSVRTRDPSVILTEVSERLAQEPTRQLSTILSVGEEEDAIVGSAQEPETSSMSSIRAVATGSTMGTQRRDNTVRRNRHSVLRTFNDTDGVAALLPVSTTDGDTGTQDEPRGEEFVECEPKGKSIRSVRFNDSADNTQGEGNRTFGRASTRRYVFPTVVDGNPSTVEASTSGGTVVDEDGSTRKKEKDGGLWENMLNTTSDDPGNAASTSSTLSGGTGAELKRQPKRGIEVESGGSGSSIGDDSTLTVGSDLEPLLVDSQLPVEEDRKPRSREVVAASGFAMGSDLVLSRPIRIQYDTHMAEEVHSDECGVSAFGLRAKSPRWDSQTSNADSDPGDGELSSGYFTGSSSSNENMEGEPRSGRFLPVDAIRKGVDIEDEMNMHGALNGKLRVD